MASSPPSSDTARPRSSARVSSCECALARSTTCRHCSRSTPQTAGPIGVAVYLRADLEHVTVLHLGISEEYCAGGPQAASEIAAAADARSTPLVAPPEGRAPSPRPCTAVRRGCAAWPSRGPQRAPVTPREHSRPECDGWPTVWLLLALAGVAAASLAAMLAPLGWPFELFVHFRPQYGVTAALLAPMLLAPATAGPGGGRGGAGHSAALAARARPAGARRGGLLPRPTPSLSPRPT